MALSDCLTAYLNSIGIPKLRILKSVLTSLLAVLGLKKIDLDLSLNKLTLRAAADTVKLAILEPIYSGVLGEMDQITSTFTVSGGDCPQVSDMVEFIKDGLEKEVKTILTVRDEKAKKEKAKSTVTAKKNRIDTLITFVNEVIVAINGIIP